MSGQRTTFDELRTRGLVWRSWSGHDGAYLYRVTAGNCMAGPEPSLFLGTRRMLDAWVASLPQPNHNGGRRAG